MPRAGHVGALGARNRFAVGDVHPSPLVCACRKKFRRCGPGSCATGWRGRLRLIAIAEGDLGRSSTARGVTREVAPSPTDRVGRARSAQGDLHLGNPAVHRGHAVRRLKNEKHARLEFIRTRLGPCSGHANFAEKSWFSPGIDQIESPRAVGPRATAVATESASDCADRGVNSRSRRPERSACILSRSIGSSRLRARRHRP